MAVRSSSRNYPLTACGVRLASVAVSRVVGSGTSGRCHSVIPAVRSESQSSASHVFEATAGERIALARLHTLVGTGARPFLHSMTQLINERKKALYTQMHSRRHGSDPQTARRRTHFATARATVPVSRLMRADLAFWHPAHHMGWQAALALCIQRAIHGRLRRKLDGLRVLHQDRPVLRHSSGEVAYAPPGRGRLLRTVVSASGVHLHTASGQMTWCEMFAVFAAFSTYAPALRDSSVQFRIDNEPGIHAEQAGYQISPHRRAAARHLHHRSRLQHLHSRRAPARRRQRAGRLLVPHSAARRRRHCRHLARLRALSLTSLLCVSFVHSHRIGDERSRPSSTSCAATG